MWVWTKLVAANVTKDAQHLLDRFEGELSVIYRWAPKHVLYRAGPKPGPVSAWLIKNMSSPTWSFFSVAEDNNKTCLARIPRGGKKTSRFNITNLIALLKRCHRGEAVLKEYCAAAVAAGSATWSVDVPIQQMFQNCKNFHELKAPSRAVASSLTCSSLPQPQLDWQDAFATELWTSDVSPVSVFSCFNGSVVGSRF